MDGRALQLHANMPVHRASSKLWSDLPGLLAAVGQKQCSCLGGKHRWSGPVAGGSSGTSDSWWSHRLRHAVHEAARVSAARRA
eukprot:9517291-Alexandrium_andersonii.AAC.1